MNNSTYFLYKIINFFNIAIEESGIISEDMKMI